MIAPNVQFVVRSAYIGPPTLPRRRVPGDGADVKKAPASSPPRRGETTRSGPSSSTEGKEIAYFSFISFTMMNASSLGFQSSLVLRP